MNKILKKQEGVTIVEALAALALFALLSTAVYGFVTVLLKSQQRSFGEIVAGTEARQATLSVADQIRGAIQSAAGSYPIESASNQALTIYTDADKDGVVEKVRFFLNGTDFKTGNIEPQGSPATYPAGAEKVSTLAHYVRNGTNPIFYYYDKNYTGTQSALNPQNIGEIRLIKIALTVDVDPNRSPPAINIETLAELRNLKDNL